MTDEMGVSLMSWFNKTGYKVEAQPPAPPSFINGKGGGTCHRLSASKSYFNVSHAARGAPGPTNVVEFQSREL